MRNYFEFWPVVKEMMTFIAVLFSILNAIMFSSESKYDQEMPHPQTNPRHGKAETQNTDTYVTGKNNKAKPTSSLFLRKVSQTRKDTKNLPPNKDQIQKPPHNWSYYNE